jgi:uncharacterized protein GlcG (DUF336 family)
LEPSSVRRPRQPRARGLATLIGIAGTVVACSLASCSDGQPLDSGVPPSVQPDCSGSCFLVGQALSVAEVEQVIAQAVHEANARGADGTIAVVDRVGNVLAVYRMSGAATQVTVDSGRGVDAGLDGLQIVPDELAAIAKAVTGAYLSSEGNAFSTRTASQIVQEHFAPLEQFAPSGPLFGVQFSALPCSDVMARDGDGSFGPKRSPLGLAADPGGFPLYKSGVVVGGVGVIADGVYGLDLDISDRDQSLDEQIALAASSGFAAPDGRVADRITADGRALRFTDARASEFASDPATAPAFGTLTPADGALLTIAGYADGLVHAGTTYGTAASGVRADPVTFPGLDAFVLVDAVDAPRYPPTTGSEPVIALTAAEVDSLLSEALTVAGRARAQIRLPLGTRAQVSVAVVDSAGALLGLVRNGDAPVFGIDVAVQKARSAALFARSDAATLLSAAPDAQHLTPDGTMVADSVQIADYVTAFQAFTAQPTGLDGTVAYSSRAIGNLARPYYPDGIAAPNGPLSLPFATWSPFATGLQLDLSYNEIITHVVHVIGGGVPPDVVRQCSGLPEIANGLQIFPGGVPIYRAGQLVGAIGVSGDGVDQDDMVAFLGLHNAAAAAPGTFGNAPPAMRSDQLTPQGVRLRYAQCPQSPFLDSAEQLVCDGK